MTSAAAGLRQSAVTIQECPHAFRETRECRLAELTWGIGNLPELPKSTALFERQRIRDRHGATRHRHARRSARARDRNLFRPAAGSIERAKTWRARERPGVGE